VIEAAVRRAHAVRARGWPARANIEEIESSSRVYLQGGALYLSRAPPSK
jgi:hypothetical protein